MAISAVLWAERSPSCFIIRFAHIPELSEAEAKIFMGLDGHWIDFALADTEDKMLRTEVNGLLSCSGIFICERPKFPPAATKASLLPRAAAGREEEAQLYGLSIQ